MKKLIMILVLISTSSGCAVVAGGLSGMSQGINSVPRSASRAYTCNSFRSGSFTSTSCQ